MALPWAKHRYLRLPMGICNAAGLFQSIMSDLFKDLGYVLAYLDDLLIVEKHGEAEEEHLKKIEAALERLQGHGFQIGRAHV